MHTEPPTVVSSREARELLGETLHRFRAEHAAAAPLIFGAHRRPEAAVIPYELYREIVPVLEDLEIARIARDRIAAGPAEPIDDLLDRYGVIR